MAYILFLAAASLLLLTVSGAYVFVVSCIKRKDLPWLVKEEIEKTAYGKYYEIITHADRWLNEHKAQDVSITSYDGLKLHGLWVPAKNPRGTILFAHGYRSTYLVDFSLAMPYYHEQNMNLLIPDQRCHGKSEGKYITFGVKESRDMLSWLGFHNEQHANLPVILSGLSMGASTMMYLADEKLPNNVKGIIADCGFTSPREILSSVFTSVVHLPASPSLWITEVCARLFAGFSLTEKDSRISLQGNTLPIIMVHGTADSFVPCRMTEEAYAVCTGPKQILLVEGAEHGVSFLIDKPRYVNLITRFLAENIGH